MNRKILIYTLSVLSFFLLLSNIHAQELKLASVNMLLVINESNKGKKSKQLIESQVKQVTQDLNNQKQKIESIQNELRSSLILSENSKKEKQLQVQKLVQELQNEQAKQEQGFRNLERQKTQEILIEVKKLLQNFAKKQGYDFIYEAQVAAGFLYSKNKIMDITQEVLKAYNESGK